MKTKFILILLLVFFSQSIRATHLIGGTITYKHLGLDEYQITFTGYWNNSKCEIPSPLQSLPIIAIELYDEPGNYMGSIPLPRISITNILPYQGSCVLNDSCYYINRVIYQDTITLFGNTGGYHLYFELCCHYASIQNISNANTTGEGFYTFIPDRLLFGNNSSPEWNIDPPLFYCLGYDVNYDNSAYDIDGDSLVYSFYQPFTDYASGAPNLIFNNNQPLFQYVNFIPPYHTNNVLNLNGTDSLRINEYGKIHGVPDNLGYFQAGIRCDEYRNGILMSSIFRDLRYTVINCPPIPVADFTPIIDCAGSGLVQFNSNTNADNYFWDFDTTVVSNDTSNLASPSFAFTANQCYSTLFLATNNNGCFSSLILPVCVGQTIADFSFPNPICDNSLVNFINQSAFPTGSNMSFIWVTSQGDTSYLYHPDFILPSGNVSVTLIAQNPNGCNDMLTQSLVVDKCIGIPDIFSEFGLNYYPNPFKDKINFQINNGIIMQLKIMNSLGQIVKEFTNSTNAISIDLSKLSNGIYYFSASLCDGNMAIGKIMKE